MIESFTPVAAELWVVADDGPADPPRLGLVIGWTPVGGVLLAVVVEMDDADGELRGWPWVWKHHPRGRFPRSLTYHTHVRAAEQRMRELERTTRTIVDLDDLNQRTNGKRS